MRVSFRVVLLVVTIFCWYLYSVNASGRLSVIINLKQKNIVIVNQVHKGCFNKL